MKTSEIASLSNSRWQNIVKNVHRNGTTNNGDMAGKGKGALLGQKKEENTPSPTSPLG